MRGSAGAGGGSITGIGGNAQSGFHWIVSPEVIARNLDRWWLAVMRVLESELNKVGNRITAWSKANHPWRNITGAAERSLNTTVERIGDALVIIHKADAGLDGEGAQHVFWMEVRWNGVYGVLKVSLQHHYDDVMSAVKLAMRAVTVASRMG